jgi:hypothetical protein
MILEALTHRSVDLTGADKQSGRWRHGRTSRRVIAQMRAELDGHLVYDASV